MSDKRPNWIDAPTQLTTAPPFHADEPAVEIAALFDDAVVDVAHIAHERAGDPRRRARPWFAAGAALLALAVVAFAIAVGNAVDNKAALAAWNEAGKPVHDFRPHRLSLGYDWMAFGGALGGLFAIGFGLWLRRAQQARTRYETDDAFPLVTPAGDGFVCNVTDDMQVELFERGALASLGEARERGRARPSAAIPGATEVAIPHDGRVRVRRGLTTYVLATVPPPRQQVASPFARVDATALAHVAGSALAHGAVLLMLFNLPPDAGRLSLDGLGETPRYVPVSIAALEDSIAEPSDDADEGKSSDEGAAGGAEAGEAGAMGIQESKNPDGRYLIEKRRDKPEFSRSEAIATARMTGILSVFGADRYAQDPFATLTGTTDLYSSGIGDRDIYGGLTGDEYRDAYGGWGTAVDGMAPGGGGDKWGIIGTGRYNTIGDGGDGPGDMRWNPFPPGKKLRRDPKLPETLKIGDPVSVDYDKELIRRAIKQKRNQLRHCYEKQLLVQRDLEGTVTTVFMINAQGAVVSVQASGLDSDPVESCVASTIKSIQFPKPAAGGLHKVTYPFHFRPAGGA